MSAKISRRQVAIAIVNMIENGSSLRQVARQLAAFLVDTRQTRSANLYLHDIQSELAHRFGLVAAEVVSANTLSDGLERQIKQLVQQTTSAKTVEIIKTVDPELVGGVVISTSDAQADLSVRARLQKLNRI